MHTIFINPTIITACQFAPDNVPIPQKVIERACGSRAMYDKNPTPLIKKAFIAIPVKSNLTIELLPDSFDTAKTKTSDVDSIAPKQAANGKVHTPALNLNDAPNTKYNAAPNAAPLDVPTKPGSTMGFRNRACINVPPTARHAPTIMHNKALGNLISMKIRSFKLIESELVKYFRNDEKISSKLIFTAPYRIEINATPISKKRSTKVVLLLFLLVTTRMDYFLK
jgi:hypothetical protein